MFQFPRFPPPGLCVRPGGARASPGGFSHSETPGSKAVCASPGTIAACRVLLRLHVPRHPPCALDIFPPRGRAAGRVPTSSNLLPQAGPRPGLRAPGGPTHLCRRLTSFSFLHVYIDGFRCTPLSGVPIESISSSLSRHLRSGGASSLCGSQGARGRTPGTGHAGGREGSSRGTRAHLRRNIVCEIWFSFAFRKLSSP